MRCLAGLVCVLALGVMPLVGCSDSESAGGSAGDGGTRTAELEEFLDDYVDEHKIDETGIAVALVGPDGMTLLEGTYGMANLEESVSVTPETVFDVASVSKQFTATAIMMLYEDGLVAPEDLVSQAFTEAPEEWAAMTVHHLLTHQSGLPDYANDQPPHAVEGWDNDDVLAYLLKTPLEFPPGSEFEYSTSGYVVLAMLLERVTGEAYPDFMQERVFAPLGMSDTLVPIIAPPDVPNLARSYLVGSVWEHFVLTYGDTRTHSTLADLIQWELGIRDAALLSPDTFEVMFTRHVEIPEDKQLAPHYDDCGYGYGWMLCNTKVGSLQHHGGRWDGFRSAIDRHPSEGLTTIMLSNGSYEWTYEIGPSLMEFYLDDSDIGAFEAQPSR